jgi:hypothetical protein
VVLITNTKKIKIGSSFHFTLAGNNEVTVLEIYAKLGKIATLGWQHCKNFSSQLFSVPNLTCVLGFWKQTSPESNFQ